MSDAVILATISASAARRVLGASILAALGCLLVWIAFTTPPALGWQILLVAIGVTALAGTARLWQATTDRVELTAEVLRDSSGRVLARVEDIVRVDRGAFAFKPSNGFVVITRMSQPRGWAPGLWWRLGRRIGVGGVTNAGEAKFMAETLGLMLAERDDGATG